MSEQGCKHNFLGTEYDPAQCTECGVTLSEWKDDRIEALEAERNQVKCEVGVWLDGDQTPLKTLLTIQKILNVL